MASNIIAPQPLPSSVALTEDLIKMFTQPHATVLNELVEKDPAALKRAFPQVFSQNEPPGKRAPPPFQLPQMQNNLTNLTQQQLLQHQVMQQALSRGTMPANFTLPGNIPLSMASVPPHIDLDKIRKEQQQQLHQQQIQQQAQQLQQQQQQQLQQLQQQQMYQQQQQHQLQILQQHQRAMQQQQQQQQSLQQIQQLPAGQAAVRAGMMDLRNQQPPMDYSTLLRMQLAQNAQTAQNQALQAQMPPRRQTISTATLPQSMANAIPRLHRPSPQLLPNTSPILSTSAPVGPAAVPTPKVQTFMQPIVPTRSPVAVPAIPTTTRGPDEADFVKFIHNVRQVEQQYHNLLGDGMVRLPSSSSKE